MSHLTHATKLHKSLPLSLSILFLSFIQASYIVAELFSICIELIGHKFRRAVLAAGSVPPPRPATLPKPCPSAGHASVLLYCIPFTSISLFKLPKINLYNLQSFLSRLSGYFEIFGNFRLIHSAGTFQQLQPSHVNIRRSI
jgi:hypothetical protein